MSTAETAFSGLGFDLAVGEVYGTRIWRMDDYGRLRALHISAAAPWRPGVNTATCLAHTTAMATMGAAFLHHVGMPLGGTSTTPPEPQPKGHAAPAEQCACGFYAYTIPTVDTYVDGYVVGLICGTGRTLIGTKGFRCEKAEIVAFLEPRGIPGTPGIDAWQRDRLRSVYPDVPLLPSHADLFGFAPIEETSPHPSTDEFWSLP